MKLPRKIVSVGSMVVFLLAVGMAAEVCQGWWPYGWPYGGFCGGYSQAYDLEKLPHFALFPPVYYSHPVPRTYGYTPFASLPELSAIAETRTIEPLVVRNPYVVASGLGATSAFPSAEGPRVVRNPFVERAVEVPGSESRLAGR